MQVCCAFVHIRRGLVHSSIALLFLTFLVEILSVDGRLWTPASFPNPRLEPERCGFTGNYIQNTSRRVCDPDGTMTSHEVQLLNELVLDSTSPCACADGCEDDGGFPIAIAIADRIQSTSSDDGFEPAVRKCKNFAEALHKEWFPDDGCQDTTLVLFCFQYKELSISIYAEVERVFSDLEIAALAGLGHDVLGADAYSEGPQTFSAGPERTPSNFTQTFIGLEQVLRQLHGGIANGPSLNSFTLYLIGVPVLLVVLIAIMCLLANWCCRQDLEASVDPQSGKHDVGHIVR